jgi:hypothetical protein
MTPEQVDLVRRSFDAIWPIRRKLAALFYSRFFELAPDAMPLFPNDMERQHLKLMDTIAAIVGALDKREMFQSIISQAGRSSTCAIWREAPAFRRVRRCIVMGLGTSARRHVYSGTERSLEDALRRRSKRNDTGGKITSVNGVRQTPKSSGDSPRPGVSRRAVYGAPLA